MLTRPPKLYGVLVEFADRFEVVDAELTLAVGDEVGAFLGFTCADGSGVIHGDCLTVGAEKIGHGYTGRVVAPCADG